MSLAAARAPEVAASGPAPLVVDDVELHQDGRRVLAGLRFDVRRGEVLAIVGPSGCGKSTLLRHLVGLQAPARGRILLEGQDLYTGDDDGRAPLQRRVGVMFQSGALFSALTVGENLMFPMRLFTDWPADEQVRQARFRLALVGLDGAFDRTPAELSGGMRKRAALARALALDPPLLCLDEPASGLDPLHAGRLDALLLHLRDHLGTTIVMATHSVDSVHRAADRVLYLDDQEQTMTALGAPDQLLRHGPPAVQAFLARPPVPGPTPAVGEDVP
jgi:phospholipid/cholesterol/gamma-HCH transport system ATP-binding protein